MAFAYYSTVTVNTGQVPSSQSNFPVLINSTDNRFKTLGNGGHVRNGNGYDIRPYSDIFLSSALSFELERYNGTTGEVVMWVKLGTVQDGSVIYLAYGDASISTDGSSGANTFSNSFTYVYHLKDGTTLSLKDSINSPTNDLTQNSVNPVTATAGKIDGGGAFVAANNTGLVGIGGTTAAITFSIWGNGTTFPAAYQTAMIQINAGGTLFDNIQVKSNGKMRWSIGATANIDKDGTGTFAALSTGTWYYFVLTYDSTAGLVGYVNATVDNTNAANGNCQSITQSVTIGVDGVFASQYWNGSLDECRVASVARSANWVTTEYNNQSAPSTFYALGTEVPVGGGSASAGFIPAWHT